MQLMKDDLVVDTYQQSMVQYMYKVSRG